MTIILLVKYFSVVNLKRICSNFMRFFQDRFLIFFLRFILPQSFESLGPLQDLFCAVTSLHVSRQGLLSVLHFIQNYLVWLLLCTSSIGLEIKNPDVGQDRGSLTGKGRERGKQSKTKAKQRKTKVDLFSTSNKQQCPASS